MISLGLRQMRFCLRSREGPGRCGPVIAGQKCNRGAGTGKTDGINRTYAPVIGACFVIAGQKWRSSPRMTLDHAWCLIRCGVSRGNGEMPGRLPAPRGACPRLTLDIDPGPPRISSPRPSPAGTGPGGRAGQVPGIRCPPAGGLVQDRPERAPDPSAPPLLGRKPGKGGTGGR